MEALEYSPNDFVFANDSLPIKPNTRIIIPWEKAGSH